MRFHSGILGAARRVWRYWGWATYQKTWRSKCCDALGQWSITLLLTPGTAILCWPCIIDWAMQEVIRLEICDVIWGCGSMVSLRGVSHDVTPPRLSWRLEEANCSVLEVVLGLIIPCQSWFPVLGMMSPYRGMFHFLWECTKSPSSLTTGWLCFSFSIRERGFNSPWSIFSIPCVKQADVWSFLFRDSRLLLSEGDQCSFPSVKP